jgi:4'-phosphopantetheinyl transferase
VPANVNQQLFPGMNRQELYKKIPEIQFIQPDEYSWNLDNKVHVWKFPATSMDFSLLSPEEKQVADRFRMEGDRIRFCVGRQALKILTSKYLLVRPSDISIASYRGKKPFVFNPVSNIHFNISHSGEWVLIALALDEPGIDVEKINPDFDFISLLDDHFIEAEKSFIANAADPVSAFYLLWTRKEALMKAWGTGLQDHMKQFSVLNMDASLDWQGKSWTITSFHISPLYPASLAYPDKTKNISFFDGNSTFTDFRIFDS